MTQKQVSGRLRLKRLCLSLLTAVISCTVIFGVGEIWARWKYDSLAEALAWEGKKGDFFTYDPMLGWKGKPNVSGPHGSGSFVTHNAGGFRDVAWNPDSQRPRVLLLGDSNMWGYGVNDDEHVAAYLNQLHPEIQWFNAGMNGYSTDQEYLSLQQIAPGLKPDWTVVLVCKNDRPGNQLQRVAGYNKPYFDVVDNKLVLRNVPTTHTEKSWVPYANRVFSKTGSFFLYHIAQTIDGYRDKVAVEPEKLPDGISSRPSADPTHLIVKAMFEVMDGRLLVMAIKPELELRAYCEENGIPFADLSGTRARQRGPLQFKGGPPKWSHWQPLGNRVAAEEIYKALVPLLDVLPQAKKTPR
ncbi:MAG: SGNH/GDSL hydrolase family protein [Verrucomicrobia bacterium]|nr:SGNH/GDSL hydrolase family protein [Verrucomicrobiota bacterium]MBU1909983.1 SGNH/GDSL hydrolase family protein [Verrucomicrobiota bacterium]